MSAETAENTEFFQNKPHLTTEQCVAFDDQELNTVMYAGDRVFARWGTHANHDWVFREGATEHDRQLYNLARLVESSYLVLENYHNGIKDAAQIERYMKSQNDEELLAAANALKEQLITKRSNVLQQKVSNANHFIAEQAAAGGKFWIALWGSNVQPNMIVPIHELYIEEVDKTPTIKYLVEGVDGQTGRIPMNNRIYGLWVESQQ
jgi:hypothetical protein